jgi:hypothetical protein
MKISSKELNEQLKDPTNSSDFATPAAPKAATPGGPGSQWRMMRLKRVYETAEEEGRPVEEVAIDRFGSLAAFEEAKEERRVLDERQGKRAERGRQPSRPGPGAGAGSSAGTPASAVRYMFTDVGGSGASSRSSSFRRPEFGGSSGPGTPSPSGSNAPVMGKRAPGPLRVPSQLGTPIPSVMTPPAGLARVTKTTTSKRALSPSSLNKLQAKVLRAKLINAPNTAALEREYDEQMRKASGVGGDHEDESEDEHVTTKVEVLPSLDAQGRLYDTGKGREDDVRRLPGNRKKKEQVCWLPTVMKDVI